MRVALEPTIRLLIVEDDPDLRALLVEIMIDEDISVWNAGNVTEALEIAERENPDVVWMDIMLPDMYGWDVAQVMIDSGCKASFIATSSSQVCLAQAELVGIFTACLVKPYSNIQELSTFVRAAAKAQPLDPVK